MKEKSKRIRIFIIGFSNEKGGVESYITNLTAALPKDKYEVIYSMPEIVVDGKVWKRLQTRHHYLQYIAFWKSFYAKTRIDVVYFNTCDVVSIDLLRFAKAAKIPVRIIHAHSTGYQQGIDKKMSLFHRLSERHSRKVLDRYVTHFFACSETAGEWMFDGRPFTVIKNGIVLAKYRYDEQSRRTIREALCVDKEKLIGIIGRISSAKNPLFTIKVLQEVFIHNDYRAVFVGDGELRTAAEDIIKQAGLCNRIHFAGAVNNVNEWLSAVDCLLMPSLFEGLPFTLVEAQAAGLPCVVSSAVSEEANISGELQYIGLEESLSAWEDAVVNAVNSPRYDAEKKLIEAGYSIEDSARAVEKMIAEALQEEVKW